MKVEGIVYAGVKTDRFDELTRFFRETMGLTPDHAEAGFETYDLPDGSKIEVYGPNDPYAPNHDGFTTGPVVGFKVDDVAAAKAELEAKGIEFLSPVHSGRSGRSQWAHFRGPDGNVYELKSKS